MLGPIRKEVQSKPEDWPSYGEADAFPTYSSQACSVTHVFSVNLKRKDFERKTTQWTRSCIYRTCPVRQEFHHSYPSVLCTGPTKPTASCSGFSPPPPPALCVRAGTRWGTGDFSRRGYWVCFLTWLFSRPFLGMLVCGCCCSGSLLLIFHVLPGLIVHLTSLSTKGSPKRARRELT